MLFNIVKCVFRLTNKHLPFAEENNLKIFFNVLHVFIASYAKELSNRLETVCTFYYTFILLQYKNKVSLWVPEGQDVAIHGIYVENSPTHSLCVICF